jgi:hypothetical protein
VAVICVAEFTVKPEAGVPPNDTAVAPVNPVPVRITELPPDVAPEVGLRPVIVGATPSMTMALLLPNELAAPGEASVKVALLPAASLIVPPLSANADVLT